MQKRTTGLQNQKFRFFLLLIAVVFLWTALVPAEAVLASTTKEEIAQVKQLQEALTREKTKLAQKKTQLTQETDVLTGELAWLNERSEEQRQLYAEKTEQLVAAVSEMEQAYADFIESEDVLAAKEDQYRERVQVMFEHRNQSLFELFLNAKSLQGFFTTMQFMQIVADADEQMLEDLEAAKDEAALKRDVAMQYKETMTQVVDQIQADLDRLKADADVKKADLDQLELQMIAFEKAEDELSLESERLAREAMQLQKKLEAEIAAEATRAAKATRAAEATKAAEATRAASQQASKDSNSNTSSNQSSGKAGPNAAGWYWPYPGDYNVYSPYGMRYHPIYHVNKMHTGVDLGGKFGNPIVAAADGIVIKVVNPLEGANRGGSGYGNYIVIGHADGLSTLYGHLKNTYVTVGQAVSGGDRIGSCGSTGTSTGSHVHFEVWVNGVITNPLPYIR